MQHTQELNKRFYYFLCNSRENFKIDEFFSLKIFEIPREPPKLKHVVKKLCQVLDQNQKTLAVYDREMAKNDGWRCHHYRQTKLTQLLFQPEIWHEPF